MPILNYTTEVATAKSIAEVHQILVRGGARAIQTEYDKGVPTSVAFSIDTPHGLRYYTLPIKTGPVLSVLKRQKVAPRFQTAEHAQRVAWRIMKDWLEAQLALAALEMVTIDQVMLPYMRSDDGRTTYEIYRDQQLALPAGD